MGTSSTTFTMICRSCIRTLAKRPVMAANANKSQPTSSLLHQARLISLLTPRRPQLTLSSILPSPIGGSSQLSATSSETLDLLPKISASPILASIQVRCGPRDTYNMTHFVRKRRHGFLSRIRTRKGRALLARRRAKGRKNLSH